MWACEHIFIFRKEKQFNSDHYSFIHTFPTKQTKKLLPLGKAEWSCMDRKFFIFISLWIIWKLLTSLFMENRENVNKFVWCKSDRLYIFTLTQSIYRMEFVLYRASNLIVNRKLKIFGLTNFSVKISKHNIFHSLQDYVMNMLIYFHSSNDFNVQVIQPLNWFCSIS